MDYEKIIARAGRRLDIQNSALTNTVAEIKILTGVPGLTKAVASLQIKRDRQANAIDVTRQLLTYYNGKLAEQNAKAAKAKP